MPDGKPFRKEPDSVEEMVRTILNDVERMDKNQKDREQDMNRKLDKINDKVEDVSKDLIRIGEQTKTDIRDIEERLTTKINNDYKQMDSRVDPLEKAKDAALVALKILGGFAVVVWAIIQFIVPLLPK